MLGDQLGPNAPTAQGIQDVVDTKAGPAAPCAVTLARDQDRHTRFVRAFSLCPQVAIVCKTTPTSGQSKHRYSWDDEHTDVHVAPSPRTRSKVLRRWHK